MIARTLATLTKAPITVTDSAWNRLKYVAQKKHLPGFLLSASSGGCNGFNYELKPLTRECYAKVIAEAGKFPPTAVRRDSIDVVVDPIADVILFGTTIDYIVEDLDAGRFESKFSFMPDKNRASSCGCGISFNPKT